MEKTIVLLGDSLTSGRGIVTAPLNVLLSQRYPGVNVINMGQAGTTALASISRLPQIAAYNPFRVVVWLGVNDVASNRSAVQLQGDLQTIYGFCHATLHCETWAMTVTPCDTDSDVRNVVRNTVNAWIPTAPGVNLGIDTWTAIRDPSDPGKRLPALADPNSIVHLNNPGMATVANLFP